jgi:hypothetical protein
MSFGRGSGAAAPESPTAAETRPTTPVDEVDAWFTEPDGAGDDGGDAGARRSDPTWLSTRWSAWKAQDRDRRTIIVLIAVAIGALLVALIAVTSRSSTTAVQLPAVESHGLDHDQAACLAYGLIEQRFTVRLGSAGFDAVDPSEISGELSQEIQALDNLAANHPEADYQLITAFAAVANAGTVLDDVDGFARYQTAVAERADAVEAAARACDQVAGFDVDELEPR